ncbi:hypothetical protein B0I35DRAFT_440209 [Stachybotrys elegans]|uniref:Uncharacterized protein n=1 Tax=Stachybotrys elegans TaxID=80388 RepID=A0A8K0SE33_9HYPO|nr:hypothetical protein B0I35DRAFT_440209 [Stachybotrys elegans]
MSCRNSRGEAEKMVRVLYLSGCSRSNTIVTSCIPRMSSSWRPDNPYSRTSSIERPHHWEISLIWSLNLFFSPDVTASNDASSSACCSKSFKLLKKIFRSSETEANDLNCISAQKDRLGAGGVKCLKQQIAAVHAPLWLEGAIVSPLADMRAFRSCDFPTPVSPTTPTKCLMFFFSSRTDLYRELQSLMLNSTGSKPALSRCWWIGLRTSRPSLRKSSLASTAWASAIS